MVLGAMDKKAVQHPMAVVTRRTGLRPDVIRAWERRYQAVRPSRTPGNHRVYTDEDISRLRLIRRAISAGWQIGQVASLPDAEIAKMIDEAGAVELATMAPPRGFATLDSAVRRCLQRIEDLDGDGLQGELERASVELGRIRVVDEVLVPLMDRVGIAYTDGSLRIAHEHLATVAVRSFLDSLRGAYPVAESAPAIVVTTPSFQHHELAAIVVSATARFEGWRSTYLGPNLPAEEIAAAVSMPGVRALALSITTHANGFDLDGELRKIGRLVPASVSIVVGGRAALGYRAAVEAIRALEIPDLQGLREFLKLKRELP
jgi:DNA-binding transcriptional MerR regulator